MTERPVLYLIDGYAVAYRQFYALPLASFTTRSGEPTNAVFGFTRLLLDILQKDRPRYLSICFDAGMSGRDEVYDEYKATRDKMPEELESQVPRLRQMAEAFSIPVLTLDGYEADDVIGTISRQAVQQDLDVLIVTGDKDILQLVTPHVRVQLPANRGPDRIYDEEAFRQKFGGLSPAQLVDLKALMGDSSDNIPGIRSIGEKTGIKLLLQYHTLDGIYEHINEISGSLHKKLVEGRELAYISRELARIQCDLPLELDLKMCVAQDYDAGIVADLFRELEFRSLLDRLQNHDLNQLPLFGGEEYGDSWDTPQLVDTEIVQDKAGLDALVQTLRNAEIIAWDVETDNLDQMQARLVGIALAVDGEKGYYVPVGHAKGTQIEREHVLDALRGPLTDPDIPKIAHNAVYDLVVTQRYGVDVQPITFDTMIAEWVRDPISRFLGLKNFARQHLGVTMVEIAELIGSGKDQKTMDQLPIKQVAPYAAADAVITVRAYEYLLPKLQKMEMDAERLLHEIEMPLVPVIAAMERAGVALDVAHLREMSGQLQAQLEELERRIHELGGGPFNVNSPKQLNEVLFDHLKLSVEGLKKTSHGYSTDINTLEALKGEHEIIGLIMEYREISKIKGTYVDALPELINPETGRLHTSYNQTGTSTGRFSSSNPNLQNIPIRTEIGREVRRAFIAPQGCRLLAVDYSQIELRVMAHISQDETLLEAFRQGQDIHRATAAAVYGVPPEEVTYEQRSFAKRVNFGLMYGMGPHRLMRESDLTIGEAERFIKTYFERLPGVERYINETKRFAHEHGYVQTLLGRRRSFPQLQQGSTGQRAQAELRAAINMPIQGTAADILKIAMIRLYQRLNEQGFQAQITMQVHDELVLEVPEDELRPVTELVVDTMENAYELRIPLVANAQHGLNWRDMVDAR